MTSTHDRFTELHDLLQAYEATGHTFDDTMEAPGKALASYLRVVAATPQRAASAVRELDDLLAVGLFSDEIADEVDLLPHIEPPSGVGVEDCLRVVRHHLERFLTKPPADIPSRRPGTVWEWRERFPALAHLMGSYFHQDFSAEYGSHAEALDDYLALESPQDHRATAANIDAFLAINRTDDELAEAIRVLGLRVAPPKGVSLRQWLSDVRGILTHHVAP
ncbi:contact-dependent growth inhibition system immunity protein [Streptomyces kunmingensis]|uniref:Contact-dependent growth inhibition system immunity protein n=1 Tax=Streptomyces kunmingensis TaxID=68225 RepID=A0ABU6CP66_9ACTN|nr:contact-dependent growth inhibition system immunity protein [Streptomyces kunmingensis]MEB3966519.1 contact-dependent growth inhibition system immunity protein [Streptomyces kunmingensis]